MATLPDEARGVDVGDLGAAQDGVGVAGDAPLIHLFHELDAEHGRGKAAERLGVDRKTFWRAIGTGRLTPRLRDALERERVARKRAEAGTDQLEDRVSGLEGRLQDVEQQLAGGLRSVREELAGLREEVRAAGWGQTGVVASGAASTGPSPHRIYPGMVTADELPGDERELGEAMALIAEWREQWGLFDAQWPKVEGLQAEVRMLEPELVLIEEHRLTLPPGEIPWGWAQRQAELPRRGQRLETARTALRQALWRRWMLRELSPGIPRPLSIQFVGAVISGLALHPTTVAVLL